MDPNNSPLAKQFISSLAQGLAPGYSVFISQLNFSDCRKEVSTLISKKCDPHSSTKSFPACFWDSTRKQT